MISRTLSRLSAFFLALVLVSTGCFAGEADSARYFPLQDIRLLESPFSRAMDRNLAYVLAMDADRLLAPYLREAGLEPRADSYGNWESSGLDGHIGGHYLTALSLAWAATGRQDVRDRLDYMLAELQRAQRANGNGYLGGVPGGKKLWADIAAGRIEAEGFSLNGSWVPWYNLHKLVAGLRDAWLIAGDEQAREMLLAWAGWSYEWLSRLDDSQVQTMLTAEHGGLNEVFADVAVISGEPRFLRLAERLSHRAILDPLLENRDALTGLHANTQIPKVIGFERIAQVSGNGDWRGAAEYFWDTVVSNRSVAIGGNSVREHFHAADNFSPMMQEVEGPETCNTYNMLRLTQMLWADHRNTKFADYYERALYNHILSSQDPETGGLVYFTPMRPQHYRMYSQVHDAMWCCVGSGIENHFKYGEFIYAHDDESLFVNLFIPSRLNWPEQGLVLRQENRFPDQDRTEVVFESDTTITLALRYPGWVTDPAPQVRVNDELLAASVDEDGYVRLARTWQAGDRVTLELPMEIRGEALPDGSPYEAVLYGPVVLAAATSPFENEHLEFLADDSRMAHVASGPVCPVDQVPLFVSETPDFAGHIERIDSDELRFRFNGLSLGDDPWGTELIPFFRLHRSRYMVYWPVMSPATLAQSRAAARHAEEQLRAMEQLTVDAVAPGEQQPEVEHGFQGEDTETGINFDRHWRHAAGWFGYTLSDPDLEANFLRIDYWGADSGRTFTIEMNGIVVAEVALSGARGAEFVSVDYPLSEAVRAAAVDGQHVLKFVAGEHSIAGGIYGVRLLRALPEAP